jgi:hypothetical protein
MAATVAFDGDAPARERKPLLIVNDAAMQALGSYRGGTMLFPGLGTGLGSMRSCSAAGTPGVQVGARLPGGGRQQRL